MFQNKMRPFSTSVKVLNIYEISSVSLKSSKVLTIFWDEPLTNYFIIARVWHQPRKSIRYGND